MKSSCVIKRVLKYIGKYKFSFIISLVLTLFSTVCTLYIPVLAGEAIDMIVSKGNVNFAGLTKILFLILVAIIIGGISQYFTNTLNNRMANNTVKDMRTDAFNNLQYVPVSYIDSRNTGDIVSRIIADAEQFSDGLILGFQNLFSGVITILGTLFFMFTINIWLALIVLVLTPLSLFVSKFISKRTYKYFKKQSEQRGKETSYIEEMLSNIKVVKSYHREDENSENFDVINEELGKDSLNATFFSSLTNPCTRFVNSIVYAVVGLSGALFAINGIITVGNLSASLAYANQYTKPFNDITGVITELQNAIACAGRLLEVIDAEKESDAKGQLPSNVKGDFTVSDVAFSYDKNKELIKNLSFELKSGQRLAVVGPTGCGKTTLINLLMHFYDIDSGSIKVDSVDINTVSRKSLRQNVGMVLQDTWLKSGTIKENIVFGNENVTDEQVIEAAKKSHAHSFIKKLHNGYDTFIGEDGGSLSTGQKQLICITRLMLNPPPILILDEATSSIDLLTEQRITRSFMKLTYYEFRKIIGKRIFLIVLALCFVINIFLLYYTESSKEENSRLTYADKYVDMVNQYKELPTNDAIKKVKNQQLAFDIYNEMNSLAYATDEDEVKEITSTLQQYKKNNPDAYKKAEKIAKQGGNTWESIFLTDISNQLDYIKSFPDFIGEMRQRADLQSSVSVFEDKGSFSYNNLYKTADDYEHLKNVKLSVGNSNALSATTNYNLTDYLVIAIVFLACIYLFGYERDKGLFNLVKSSKNGRLKTILAKLFVLFVVSLVVSLLFTAGNYVTNTILYGADDLNRNIQSISEFRNCVFDISAWQYLILFAFMKVIGVLIIASVFSMVFILVSSPALMYIISVGFVVVEY
ncbi:MAG: ATP-binding cassette domain-containing protein [Ruminococcaceae bacterium]|nr:ATP-binding cassette domain-containing protein [Oscillospiraceae bacterium]